MELDTLMQAWKEQEEKLDRNWKLNMEVLRRINLDKAKSKMNTLIWVTASSLAFYISMAVAFIIFAIKNQDSTSFVLSAVILSIWSIFVATGAIQQLDLIVKIDYTEPIPMLQKKLETLKLVILRYIRLGIWILPVYLAFVVFWVKLIFDFDIIANAGNTWVTVHLVLSALLVPVTFWMYQKLDPKNMNKKWMKNIMGGTGSQIYEAQEFIEEIEAFEKE